MPRYFFLNPKFQFTLLMVFIWIGLVMASFVYQKGIAEQQKRFDQAHKLATQTQQATNQLIQQSLQIQNDLSQLLALSVTGNFGRFSIVDQTRELRQKIQNVRRSFASSRLGQSFTPTSRDQGEHCYDQLEDVLNTLPFDPFLAATLCQYAQTSLDLWIEVMHGWLTHEEQKTRQVQEQAWTAQSQLQHFWGLTALLGFGLQLLSGGLFLSQLKSYQGRRVAAVALLWPLPYVAFIKPPKRSKRRSLTGA